MKTFKTWLTAIVALLCGVTMNVYGFEVDGISYNQTSLTTVEVAKSTKYSGIVTIPEKVTWGKNTYSVTGIQLCAFENCTKMTSITIPNSVTFIDIYAFKGCTGLKDIVIPDNVTSIGYGVFEDTPWYKNKPNGVVYAGKVAYKYKGTMPLNKEVKLAEGTLGIAINAFRDCSNLVAFIAPEGLVEIGTGAFTNCSNLKSVIIPNSVNNIGGGVFEGTSWINNQPEGLVYAGKVLYQYKGTMPENTIIQLPEGTTGIANRAFADCKGLTKINIPNTVMVIGGAAFDGCESLTSVAIPNGVKELRSYTFQNCTRLTSVSLPKSLQRFSSYVFYRCAGLEEITMEGFNPPFSTSNESLSCKLMVPKGGIDMYKKAAFWKSFSNIEEYKLDIEVDGINYNVISYENKTAEVTYKGSNLYPRENPYKGNVVIPNSINYDNEDFLVTNIGEYAFYYCPEILSLTIPASVISMDEYSFNGADNLKELILEDGDKVLNASFGGNLSSLESLYLGRTISSGFRSLSKLTSLVIGEKVKTIGDNWFKGALFVRVTIPESVLEIGNSAFSNCSNLEEVVIEGENISLGGSCFSSCKKLSELTVRGVKNIEDGALRGCSNLQQLILPNNIQHIGTEAFYNCNGLKKVIINSLGEIESRAFKGCTGDLIVNCNIPNEYLENNSLTAVFYESSFTSLTLGENVESIGRYAFYKCTWLKSLTISENVKCIEKYAFSGCSSLTSIAIPEGAIEIKDYAFGSCSSLTEVVCEDKIPATISSNTFNNVSTAATLYVPISAKDVYASTTGWDKFNKISEYSLIPLFYMVDGEVYHTDSVAYGQTIKLPENPIKEGCRFIGWDGLPETMPISDVTVEALFVPNKYVVKYVIDGETYRIDSVAYGDSLQVIVPVDKEGYTFGGWSDAPAVMPADSVVITGTFIINKYVVTFKIGDEVIASDSLEYGTSIVAPDAPMKEGYTFDGWGEIAEVVPAYDVTYGGSYTVNTYKVYYYVDGELVHTAEIAYGEAIPEYVYESIKDGKVFIGWIGETYESMPAHNVIYTANITTGIDQLKIDYGQQATVYDLQGRKVLNTDNLKGIYIVDGKKVVFF